MSQIQPHPTTRRGRGAVSNDSGRFEVERRERVDDGWDTVEDDVKLDTELIRDTSRNIIATNNSPDVGFDRSINPYRGCEHGCAYCFARPTHAYLGYSPGLDFESKILFKPDAARLLEKAFRRQGYDPDVIALGVNTDAYQPVERRLGITRSILEVMQQFRHPVCIITKSHLVTRDIDILADLATRDLAKVLVSLTSLDHKLSRHMEPRAATPAKRLDAIRQLRDAGIAVGCMVAPMIPGLNDHEMENLLSAAKDAGAQQASYILLRLPREISQLWREWLAEHYPDRADRVMDHIRTARGGKDYDSRFHRRMRGTGPYAEMLAQRFRLCQRRLSLDERDYELSLDHFRVPDAGSADGQLSLL